MSKNNTPSPGTEASLRRWIDAMEKGQPNYSDMTPALAGAAYSQRSSGLANFKQLGAFKSLAFERVGPIGTDTYIGTFAHGRAEFNIWPLLPDGKVEARNWRVLP